MRTLNLLVLATAAAATASAHADTNNDELWLGATTRALRTPSANALTDGDLDGGSLGYARDLGVTFSGVPDLAVWAEASMTSSKAIGTMFQTMDTDIRSLGLTGGLRLRYLVHRPVSAFVRAELGAQRVELELRAPDSAASDHGWGRVASAGVGLDLFASARPAFGIGLRAELGYVYAQAIELTPRGEAHDDALRLPMTAVPLGKLDLSGPSLAISVFGQF